MVRLILLLLIVATVVVVVGAIQSVFAPASAAPAPKRTDPMPAALRNVAFALLIVLMFGVVTGWMVPG